MTRLVVSPYVSPGRFSGDTPTIYAFGEVLELHAWSLHHVCARGGSRVTHLPYMRSGTFSRDTFGRFTSCARSGSFSRGTFTVYAFGEVLESHAWSLHYVCARGDSRTTHLPLMRSGRFSSLTLGRFTIYAVGEVLG